jgi:hypothetical protein
MDRERNLRQTMEGVSAVCGHSDVRHVLRCHADLKAMSLLD